jgi:MFS family permease
VDWLGELGVRERRAFVAAFGGWALDALDYMVFSFVIPTLISLWGITRGEAGLLATVTLLVSALGGWAAGLLADRIGRVHVLQITILWFAVFTFASGFTNNFGSLIATRALQGFGFGGEWAVGSVLMGEIVSARNRGKAVGTVQSGWAVGWGAAAILYSAAFSLLPEEMAWRALFWIGIAPALLVFYIRRFVPEPEVFQETRRGASRKEGAGVLAIFAPEVIRTTLLAALLTTGAQGGYYAITTWLPTFLRTVRNLTVLNTSGYLAFIITGSFAGYLAGAYLADRIGRRMNFVLFAIGSALVVLVYTTVEIADDLMLVLGFPLGFFASGIFSGMGAFLTELFPSRMRGSGQGFTYNFGRGVGALFPTVVGYMSSTLPLGTAIGLFAGSAYALVVIAVAGLPETKGKELLAYD